MGVDLTLLPFERSVRDDWAIAHSVLGCERRRGLFEVVAEVETAKSVAAPLLFSTYIARDKDGETRYGNTQETPYGDKVRVVTVADLLPLADHEDVLDNPKNRAVWAYLGQLAPETRVALYWH